MGSSTGITLAPRALRLGDDELGLMSGAMHYFRLPRKVWGACLRAVKSLGFGLVESYVPWGVHETSAGRGRCRFEGSLDLGAFLDEAAGEGLKVLLRPGPHINAELTFFGLPERIVRDERMLSRSARGTPTSLFVPPRAFPVPSYFARAFQDEVSAWYARVAEVVAPRLWPRGPVVALQVDNELGHFFRAGPFDGDYHPDALAAWAEASGGKAPPRRFSSATREELALQLEWLAFKERGMTRALATLGAALDAVGLVGVPRYHNFPPVEPTIYDLPAAESVVDFAGVDLYHPRQHYDRIRRRSLLVAGSSRLPYVPEVAAGSYPWGPAFSSRDSRTLILGALMHGVAGVNVYMAVDRDRWYGAPVSATGEVRSGLAELLRGLNAAMQQAGWTGLERAADVAVVVPRGYRRLAVAASHLGPVGPALGEFFELDGRRSAREDALGFAGPIQIEQEQWTDAIVAALGRAHLPFVIAEPGVAPEMLAKRRLLVVPTFDFLDVELAARLRAYAAGGGRVLYGPRLPSLDAALQQADGAALALPGDRLDGALLGDPRQLQAVLASAAESAGARRPAPAKEPTVDTALHVRADGSPALLFLATRSSEPITATVELGGAATLEDALDKPHTRFTGATLSVPLEPFQVRLLRYT